MEKKTYPTFPPDLGKAALVAFFSLVANRHRALDRRRQRHCAALVEESLFFFYLFFCAALVEEVTLPLHLLLIIQFPVLNAHYSFSVI